MNCRKKAHSLLDDGSASSFQKEGSYKSLRKTLSVNKCGRHLLTIPVQCVMR